MRLLTSWDRGLSRVSSIAAVLSAAAVGVLAIVVAAGFFMRLIADAAIPGLIEFSESLIVLVVFLGLAHGERMQSQIRMTLVTDAVPAWLATAFRLVAMVGCAVIIGLFAWETSIAAWNSFVLGEVRFGLLRFPLWPARLIIAIGFWMLLLVYLTKAASYTIDLLRRDYARYDDGRRTPYSEGVDPLAHVKTEGV